VVAVVVLAGTGGYVGYRHFSGHSTRSVALLAPCPAATPSPPAALQARLAVRNATLKTGLAAQVAHQLRQRHFRVGTVGNTLFRGKGVATVQYSADRADSARLVAAQFSGATMTEVGGSRILEVDIGPKYRSLLPAAEAQAAERAILATASPVSRSSPTPTPTPSPSCAARSS
jgi:hypothetical protein